MASHMPDVVEDILTAPVLPAQFTMASDDPYQMAMSSAIVSQAASTSALPAASTQGPSSSLGLPGTSRQLTLHQALARVAPRFAHRATARMSVRPTPSPLQIDAHSLLSEAPPTSLRRRPRSPTTSSHGSPSRRRRVMRYSSDEEEEYEGEDEADDPEQEDDPQEAEHGDDDDPEEEDDPQEDEMPDDDDDELAPPAQAEEPDSPVHPIEPDSPDHPFLFELPPGSPVESDASSEVSAEHAELGEVGRLWARITELSDRVARVSDRLERVIGEFLADLRVDLTVAVGRATELRRVMMDVHEHIDSLQRGFVTAREADRKLWQRNAELEKEVADLKRDRDTHSVELGSLWRDLDGLRQELRSLRQQRG